MGEKERDLDFRCRELSILEIGLEFFGDRIKKQKNGTKWFGLCHFHKEKSPSFYLKPQSNEFFCYGCKTEGTALSLSFQ